MAARAKMTGELPAWTDVEYNMPRQNDGTSGGILALMVAEAVAQGQPLSTVDPVSVSFSWRYIKTRLLINSRSYNVDGYAVCDMPICSKPKGSGIMWAE